MDIMKSAPFGCARSYNNQLHNKISQEDEYNSYLNRIKNIVNKKIRLDDSPEHYMNFLHKSRDASHRQTELVEKDKINLQNNSLLKKIVSQKSRKPEKQSKSYHLAMNEKRERQLRKINQENAKIAQRINSQYSVVSKTHFPENKGGEEKDRKFHQGWNYSPIKKRKLPQLIKQKENRS